MLLHNLRGKSCLQEKEQLEKLFLDKKKTKQRKRKVNPILWPLLYKSFQQLKGSQYYGFPFPKNFPKIIEMLGLFQYFKIFKLIIGKNNRY
jgi:hypothetical protein